MRSYPGDAFVLALCAVASIGGEWQRVSTPDPSPHRVRFVSVAKEVRLEVLDWGGAGHPVVLLAGSGNTAHVFDEFAPKLTNCCRVYAVTRRGFGSSDHPSSGYDDQRLADDIVEVLRALNIQRPVVAGHSMAGGELTTIGAQHSDLLAGLVYLDALGDPRDWPASDPAYRELASKVPEARRGPAPVETSSFSAYRASQLRTEHFTFPESELRQMFEANDDGTVGRYKASDDRVRDAIGMGQKRRDYSKIKVPVLAMFEYPRPGSGARPAGTTLPPSDDERAARDAFSRATAAYVDRWVKNLQTAPVPPRIVDLPGAGHFVFLTREAEVLNEMRTFVASIR